MSVNLSLTSLEKHNNTNKSTILNTNDEEKKIDNNNNTSPLKIPTPSPKITYTKFQQYFARKESTNLEEEDPEFIKSTEKLFENISIINTSILENANNIKLIKNNNNNNNIQINNNSATATSESFQNDSDVNDNNNNSDDNQSNNNPDEVTYKDVLKEYVDHDSESLSGISSEIRDDVSCVESDIEINNNGLNKKPPKNKPPPIPYLNNQSNSNNIQKKKGLFGKLRRSSWSTSKNDKNKSFDDSVKDNNDVNVVNSEIKSNENEVKMKKTEKMTMNNIKSRSMSQINSHEQEITDKIYLNRQKVYGRLRKNKSKKDVLTKLETSINKVEETLKSYVRQLVSIQNEKHKIKVISKKESKEWEILSQWEILNHCRSYYLNYNLLIDLREDITRHYCECFSNKYKELKKTFDRIKKEIKNKKYSLDDLILSVEAAIMTASNIRLPSKIYKLKENETSLTLIVKELNNKYNEKRIKIMKPMTIEERTKHLLTLLVQCCDEKKEYFEKHNYNGLPYFHSIDNGKQIPFEEILYDPRFNEKKIIDAFYVLMINNYKKKLTINNSGANIKSISKFIFKLTNEFLDSCNLNNKNYKIYKSIYWDATHLMICRNIFPKFKSFIVTMVDKNEESKHNDLIYQKRLKWLINLNQKQLLIDEDFICKNDNIAYKKAINRLQLINTIIVPQDSLVCLIDTIHDIQSIAKEYFKQNNKDKKKIPIVAGDILFPIVVYVIIKSKINNWHGYIYMMKQFYNKKILTFGQTGFCFSLLSASVQYIMQQKPSTFGLNDNIEDDIIDKQ